MGVVAAVLLFAGVQPAAQSAPLPSVQIMFDNAAGAAAKDDWSGALDGYAALEKRLGANGSPRSLAVIRVRKGEALYRLSRLEEAETELRAGLRSLPLKDESLREDRMIALLNLAAIAELSLRYPEAHARYAEAERLAADDPSRLRALAGLARTRMFDEPQAAVADADRAIAIIAALPETQKRMLGQWRTLKGRALLNLGNFTAASSELGLALKELGGLTLKVDRDDIAARSDLAIAAMLAGKKEEARKYLAYTGAGRLNGEDFSTGVDIRPPACGGPAGLQPEDVAVVEFSIRDDGSVGLVAPIYSSRKGSAALEFARAVQAWSWPPEQVKKIDPFFRELTRLEMRCSTAASRPSVMAALEPAVSAWLSARDIEGYVAPAESYAAKVAPTRAELARREASFGTQSLQLFPILITLAGNPVLEGDEPLSLLARAEAIARANGTPPAVLAAIALQRTNVRYSDKGTGTRTLAARSAELLVSASSDAGIEGDALSLSAVRIAAADAFGEARKSGQALPLLRQVAADARLNPRDPLRIGALIRIAAIEAAAGDLADARTAFEQTGLSSSQCALVDAKPTLIRSNASSSDFPMEAMRWGFEGWAVTEFDITADGKTVGVRPMMAYPPFVFGAAAQGILQGARFTQSYRPDGGLGCGGQRQTVRFSLPN